MERKSISHQIIRFDGRNTFFEVMANCFSIGKVQINFIQYDVTKEKNNRIVNQISVYVDIPKACCLCHDILSGKLPMLMKKQKDSGEQYPKPVWQDMGGISATKLAERNQSRQDGKSLSRVLKLTSGFKTDCVLQAEIGCGEEDAKGLIVPKYGNKPDARVLVGLCFDDLKKLAIMLDKHITAFYTSEYCLGAYEYDYSNSKNTNANNTKKTA